MIGFKQFVTEAKEIGNFGKLTHLQHAEDLLLDHGKAGLHHAIGALNAVHDKLNKKFNDTKVTTKYDGSSTVVFGHHPKTGKFFVGTKSAFSKTPKINYTPEDIEKNHGDIPPLVHRMKQALEHLPKVTPKKGVYQGDIMHGGLEHDVHEDDTHYHFTPNTIMYSTPKKSEEGKKIANSKFGIAVHTKYHGTDLPDMKAGFEPDVHNFKKHPHVHMLPVEAPTEFSTGKTGVAFKFHMKQLERAQRNMPPDTFDVTAGHKDKLNTYINKTVREGTKPNVDDYAKHLLSKDVDTAKKKENAMAKVKHVLDHRDHFHALLSMHNHIQKAKDALIDDLNQNQPFEHSIGGKETQPEGFVAIHNGHPVKLVNREQFSKANFLRHSQAAKEVNEEFLIEGGNVKIGAHSAEPIAVTEKNREGLQGGIHHTLASIHGTFHSEHGEHLFGHNERALHTGSAYSGSTAHLMSKEIPHKEFAKHKPAIGDIDVKIPKEHAAKLKETLAPGRRFGDYEVLGTHGHGSETTSLMKHHKTGKVHQFDFEHGEYHNDEPTAGEQFAHSSNWEDTKHGIKGAHHKMLLNAVGGELHKFSITHGLRSRIDEHLPAVREPKKISEKLFGSKADHSKIHSFVGLTQLIKKHVPPENHQKIYDKFKSATASAKKVDSSNALKHLRTELGVKDS